MNYNSNLYKVKGSSKRTIYDKIKDYLFKNYDIQYNEISHSIEIKLKDSRKWVEINLNSLIIELAQADLEISMAKLEIFMKSKLISSYNPLKNYFQNLEKWDGYDYISKLTSYVPAYEQELFLYHFKKWLVRTVKCALQTDYFNKQCFVIAHNEQNSGKSTWCRFLCPPELSNYLAEDVSNDKDARIQLCRNFLINLDELSVLAKKEINSLKSFFSKSFINERLPYDRKNTILSRVSSFIGSTNLTSFLTDETGSVRWLVFELKGKIDFGYSTHININDVWSQAYHLAYHDSSFDPELSNKDIEVNEERNSKYRTLTVEEELIAKYYVKSSRIEDFLTATDILTSLNFLNLRLSKVNIGKALSGYNFKRVKHSKKQVYGYLAKSLF